MATYPTYDYEQEQASIAQKQALMQQMMQQMGQAPAPGGVQATSSRSGSIAAILNAILPAVKGYIAHGKMDKLDAQKTDLSNRYREDLVNGMQQFEQTSTPHQEFPQGPMPDGSSIPPVDVAGDRKKAIYDALASNHPVLRDMGMKLLTQKPEIPKVEKVGKDENAYITGPDGKAQLWASGVKSPVPVHAVEGTLYGPEDAPKMVPLGGANFTKPYKDDFGNPVQRNVDTGKEDVIDKAPKVNVHTTVQAGDTALMKTLGEGTGKLVLDAQKAKTQGQRTLGVMSRLDELDRQGIFSGPSANATTTLESFATTMGIPVDKGKLGRSEAYNSELAKQTANVLMDGSVGRSMTDEDRKVFQSQFPQMIQSPAGRAQIRQRLQYAAQQDIGYANGVEQNLRKNYPEAAKMFNVAPSQVDYNQSPQAPTAPQAPGRVLTIEEYLNGSH